MPPQRPSKPSTPIGPPQEALTVEERLALCTTYAEKQAVINEWLNITTPANLLAGLADDEDTLMRDGD